MNTHHNSNSSLDQTPDLNLHSDLDCKQLINKIKLCAKDLGLHIGITKPELHYSSIDKFIAWLENGSYGTMHFMQKYKNLRINPRELMPEVKSIICCRFDYITDVDLGSTNANQITATVDQIAPYAKCRDYHKIMRHRLQQLAKQIGEIIEGTFSMNNENFQYRIFCDSAPVMEKSLAVQAALGWIGKNTLLINKQSGSYSFLGEIYTNLNLCLDGLDVYSNLNFSSGLDADTSCPRTDTDSDYSSSCCDGCGACAKCLDACPTKALHAPYSLDARKCIAYLTIEHDGTIPIELRHLIGTRIFGCNECQRCCPWNIKHINENQTIPIADEDAVSFLSLQQAKGVARRGGLQRENKMRVESTESLALLPPWNNANFNSTNLNLAELFLWDEITYLSYTAGTPLRRLGYERWLRNIAVALGNSAPTNENRAALAMRLDDCSSSALVREHVAWANQNQAKKHS